MHSNFSSPQYSMRSKPILPLDLNIRSLPVDEMQPSVPQSEYHPGSYRPPSPIGHSLMHDGPTQGKVYSHNNLPSWQGNRHSDAGYPPPPMIAQPTPTIPRHPNEGVKKITLNARDGILRQGPRQRTAQACEKCRDRKTKCSGERPTCVRCSTRGLTCIYPNRESRGRGPSKASLRGTVSTSELRTKSSDLLANSLSGTRKSKVIVPPQSMPSPQSSPTRSTYSLPVSSPISAQGTRWKGALSIARDLRRVQSHSILGTSATDLKLPSLIIDNSSCELTPRPGDGNRNNFADMLSQSAFNTMPNRRFDLRLEPANYLSGNGAGSEPRSATDSHFSFSSSSSESDHESGCSSSLGMEDLFYGIGRSPTKAYLDSYSSSPASASASSASSPSSAMWKTDLEPIRDGQVEGSPYAHTMLPVTHQLADSQLESNFATTENYDQFMMPGVSGAIGDQYKPDETISTFTSDKLLNDMSWGNYTF